MALCGLCVILHRSNSCFNWSSPLGCRVYVLISSRKAERSGLDRQRWNILKRFSRSGIPTRIGIPTQLIWCLFLAISLPVFENSCHNFTTNQHCVIVNSTRIRRTFSFWTISIVLHISPTTSWVLSENNCVKLYQEVSYWVREVLN